MVTLAAVALTCWLCSLIALPRKPLPNNEVQELVYGRLLGRQHFLMLLALVATVAAFLTLVTLARPSHRDLEFAMERQSDAACVQQPYDPSICAIAQPGTRIVQEARSDGTWIVVATFPASQGYVDRGNAMTQHRP